MDNAKRLPNYMLLRRPRTRAIRQLNNIFVVTQIAQSALDDARRTLEAGPHTKLLFSVPTIRNEQVGVPRRRSKILALLKDAAERDLFSQALVPAVAVTEGYLADTLGLILRAFPEKLSMTDKKIDLSLVLESTDLDELRRRIITNQIHSAFYASPAKYFEYIEQVLSISIGATRKSAYSEVKATRDIYVHNSGIANRVYLQKAWTLARARDGQLLPMDRTYFSSAITCLKGIVQSVYKRLLEQYGRTKGLAA